MTTPETPEQVAEAITGRYGVLIVDGIRLPVAVKATCERDAVDVGGDPDRPVIVPGLATIECVLSGVPKASAPVLDRRQRAREAGWDATVGWSQESTAAAIEAAIETATRVRVTVESIRAMLREVDHIGVNNGGIGAGVAAALRELGFEVEA